MMTMLKEFHKAARLVYRANRAAYAAQVLTGYPNQEAQ